MKKIEYPEFDEQAFWGQDRAGWPWGTFAQAVLHELLDGKDVDAETVSLYAARVCLLRAEIVGDWAGLSREEWVQMARILYGGPDHMECWLKAYSDIEMPKALQLILMARRQSGEAGIARAIEEEFVAKYLYANTGAWLNPGSEDERLFRALLDLGVEFLD